MADLWLSFEFETFSCKDITKLGLRAFGRGLYATHQDRLKIAIEQPKQGIFTSLQM